MPGLTFAQESWPDPCNTIRQRTGPLRVHSLAVARSWISVFCLAEPPGHHPADDASDQPETDDEQHADLLLRRFALVVRTSGQLADIGPLCGRSRPRRQTPRWA